MSSLFQKLINTITIDESHAAFIKKGISGSLLFEVLARLLLFGITILLTHHLTGEDYGRYSYYMGILISLATIATFGLDDMVIKQMGHSDRNIGNLMNKSALAFSLLVAGSLAFIYYSQSDRSIAIAYISGSVVLLTFQYMMSAYLKGRRHILSAQIPEQVVRLGMLFVLILFQFFYFHDFSFEGIARSIFLSVLISSIVSIGLLLRKENLSKLFDSTSWKSLFSVEVLLFAALSLFGVFRHKLDVILLGWYELFVETGVYNICSKLSDLLLVGLMLTNVLYMPLFAARKEDKDTSDLAKILKSSATINAIIGGALLLLFIAFGKLILGFLGDGFGVGYDSLILLSIATFIYAVLGPYIVMLMMVGYAKDVLIGLVIGVGIQFALAMLLIHETPVYGMAISKSVSILFIQFFMMWVAWRRLAIKPFFLPK